MKIWRCGAPDNVINKLAAGSIPIFERTLDKGKVNLHPLLLLLHQLVRLFSRINTSPEPE
jgi:hypothetical protein